MNPSALDANHALLNVRGARASSVIVHRVPAGRAERFLEWQRGITRAAEVFSGYQATDEYPPTDSRQPNWVVVVHFDNSEALQRWLDSPERAEWIAKLPAEIADFQLKTLSAGFGPWFAGLVDHGSFPPHWKMFLIVLLGLYPTVMLLTLFLSPHTNRFGLALAMLIGNAASVAFLEWLGMPVMSRLLGPWLRANGRNTRAFSLVGLALMLAALGAMTFVFHLAT